jgi:hypothetical protein
MKRYSDGEISGYFESYSYLNLKFLPLQETVSFFINRKEKLEIPNSIFIDDVQNQLQKYLILIQKYSKLNWNKEMLEISICYFLGFIEAEFYPGITKKL